MKIIVCDDEKYICEDLEKRLREYYQSLDVLILSVSSGEELLRTMEREPEEAACIFLDIEMKGMDGLETARRLRADYPDLPVLLLTSHTELAMEGYEVQAFRFLAKPLRQEKPVLYRPRGQVSRARFFVEMALGQIQRGQLMALRRRRKMG